MNRTRHIFMLLVAVTLCATARAGDDDFRWTRLPDMPLGVFMAGISRAGDNAVITGGLTQIGAGTNTVQVFDLKKNTWSTPVRLVTPRYMHAQVTLTSGKVLVIGGLTGNIPGKPVAACELIDLDKKTSEPVGGLPHAVGLLTAHLLPDGRAIAVGGDTASIYVPSTKMWTKHIDLRVRRRAHASVVLPGGRVLVVGGEGTDTLELIDPVEGVSRSLSVKLQGVGSLDDHRVALLPDGRVWLLGGQAGDGNTTDATWIIDLSNPRQTTITPGPPLGVDDGVADMAVAWSFPWAAVVGGESQRGNRDTELRAARLLNTQTLAVWSLPPTAFPHDDAVVIADGRRVIVFGGYHTQTALPDVTLPVAGIVVEALVLPEPK